LDQLLPGPNSINSSSGSFQEFFRIVVDGASFRLCRGMHPSELTTSESLFSSTSSPERKYWGFQVFQKALPRITVADMAMLFTKNFMRSWINHLSQRDRYLHKVARQVVRIPHATQDVDELMWMSCTGDRNTIICPDKPSVGFRVDSSVDWRQW